ncbi:MAG: hypothetical protein R3C61_01620 [Bacteroidia bacterium]
MIYDIFKISLLILFIIIFGEYSKVIGGFLWAILALGLRIPLIGKLYRFILFDKIKFSVLIKAATWAIGASGILMGIFVYYLLFQPTGNQVENWIILISSVSVIVNFFHRTMYLDMLDYEDIHAFGQKYVRKVMGDEAASLMDDNEIKPKLIFSNLIDTEVIRFLRYLVCIGVFYFSANQLNFFDIKSGYSSNSDLLLCIKYAFAFVPIEKVSNIEVAFEGNFWDAVNVFLGIGVFLWTIVFFNVVLNEATTIIQQHKNKNSENTLEKKFDNLENVLGNIFIHFRGLLDNLEKKIDNMDEKTENEKYGQFF